MSVFIAPGSTIGGGSASDRDMEKFEDILPFTEENKYDECLEKSFTSMSLVEDEHNEDQFNDVINSVIDWADGAPPDTIQTIVEKDPDSEEVEGQEDTKEEYVQYLFKNGRNYSKQTEY
ncbi:hypothetical protein UPYG_G00205830 [Umbra pygmaea]|uniref:Uncharacterized protein n=1 Tax=Umbra pygmaea TaxID=75934 RepID=A0ABD0WJ39_UMBPY